jgi:hypothetical protein
MRRRAFTPSVTVNKMKDEKKDIEPKEERIAAFHEVFTWSPLSCSTWGFLPSIAYHLFGQGHASTNALAPSVVKASCMIAG